MERIKERDLQSMVNLINNMTGSPSEPYAKGDDGKYKPQAHCYHLSHAYGGVSLHRMASEGSGISDVFSSGHVPKRELFHRLQAFIDGLRMKR
jgi:hypothetical protein